MCCGVGVVVGGGLREGGRVKFWIWLSRWGRFAVNDMYIHCESSENPLAYVHMHSQTSANFREPARELPRIRRELVANFRELVANFCELVANLLEGLE